MSTNVRLKLEGERKGVKMERGYCETHRRRRKQSRLSCKTSGVWAATVGLAAILLTLALVGAAAASQPPELEPQAANSSARLSAVLVSESQQQQQQQQQTAVHYLGGARQVLASFSVRSQTANITHVTYDPVHDTVYVGATNAIYQLNGSDLSEQFEQQTGPVYDNPACGITECHGYEDFMKPTQNVNKILVIDYQHQKLLSCGSTKQGACRRYQLNNISQKEDLISMAVAANDDNSSTYAFIAPARYTYNPSTQGAQANDSQQLQEQRGQPQPQAQQQQQQQQQVLYVAATYTKVGQSRDLLVPAIGTRILEEGPNLLKLYENSFLDSARIDINSHLRDYFLVSYQYGFASSNYVYFVTVQKKATSRDYEELGYHTRLARICITDSSYNSYTEVDLKCVANRRRPRTSGQEQGPSEYPLLQDAILVDAGSQLLQSLAQNDQSAPLSADLFFNNPSAGSSSADDSKVLLAVFSSAKDHTQHAGDHSALCAFSLGQIEDKFNDNIHNCYTGKMQSRNMEYIAGNVQECPRSGQGGNVVNFCHETLKINGTLPIVSEASIQFLNTTLTAITATSHVNSNSRNIYSDQLASNPPNQQARAPATVAPQASSNANADGKQQHTVVFMGTSSGHIKKILLNNASNGIEFEHLQLDSSPILGDLHLHSSGQQLIVATPQKVIKVPTYNCAQYSSCRECSQSRNPYCGWCSLKRSCTTKSDCISSGRPSGELPAGGQMGSSAESGGAKQLKWISNESAGKCIDLQSIVPNRVPITSTGKVDLHIDRLPRLPKEHSYKCIFDRKEQTTASAAPLGLSCPLPKLMHRPKIPPGRDHVIVDLAVRSSETNTDFLNGKLTFFECQLHTTCKDCLTTNWGCNWCLNENVCLFDTSKCEKTGLTGSRLEGNLSSQSLAGRQAGPTSPTTQTPIITISNGANQRSSLSLTTVSSSGGNAFTSLVQAGQRAGNTIHLVGQCPTFDVGHKQDILIADGSERELTIRVRNMPQFKGNVQCLVQIESDKISLKARIEEDRVVCENSSYSYAAEVGQLAGQLVVVYSDNNIFIDRTNFTMYKCHLLGAYLNRPDCSLCKLIEPRFKCAWCQGACRHAASCGQAADDACPPPRIDSIHPLSGPTLGGTKLTIEGSNLGQSFEEIAGRVSVANVPCKPLEQEYRPSNRIVCLTGPLQAKHGGRPHQQEASADELLLGDVVVGNRAGYSLAPSKFQFKNILLRDHQPRFGPQSGGTRLTLTGANLNAGSNIQVFLDELPCQLEPSLLSADQIVCRTSASRHPSRAVRQLKLIVDDAQIVRQDDVFFYTQDPIITKISPLRSYMSGGRPINVYGANLTSVQAPRVAILDSTGKRINESTCILQDDSRMQCPSPALNLQMMELEWAEHHAAQYEAFPSSSSSRPANQMGLEPAPGQLAQQEEGVKFRLSFIMDNVWRLRDLQAGYPALNSEIAYTSDPKLYPFASEQYKSAQELALGPSEQANLARQQSYQLDADTFLLQPGEPSLALYGENLRAAVSEYEITVTIGQDLCNLTQLTHSKLLCLIPLDHMATPTDEEGHQTQRALPLVVVRIGFNLRYELGFVQYHPLLVEQIVQTIANSSEQLPFMRPTYPQYMPRENESLFQRVSGIIGTVILLVFYLAAGSMLLACVYSTLSLSHTFRRHSYFEHEFRRIKSKIDSLEKSVASECRVAKLALQGDLNELVRHVDLSGVPILELKHYVMKVFFPGINNHPLLVKMVPNEGKAGCRRANFNTLTNLGANFAIPQHQGNLTIQHPLKSSADFPMDHFERLILTKPFLITFINTLEAQASFTIRDKVNVASLIMIILMERLDYATDILRTLLLQLVQRSTITSRDPLEAGEPRNFGKASSRFACATSGLLSGLPIGKRSPAAVGLGRAVGGSASSLMASTSAAAQTLLSRIGSKTSALQPNNTYVGQHKVAASGSIGQSMSTTAFNRRHTSIKTIGSERPERVSSNLESNPEIRSTGDRPHLMLRRTDSVVEKMLTNWLALNMYDYFQGEVGQSLYMLFEALRCQLERGPIDCITGDAYYSLNESKLLRAPYIQFDTVNLYIIVDTDILQPMGNSRTTTSNGNNLLLDSSSTLPYNQTSQPIYGDNCVPSGRSNYYATSNTITLALRALDCDTISQVKGKILSALYRNSPRSHRLGVDEVELCLRQQQPVGAQPIVANNHYVSVTLTDEDYSSVATFNGLKRLNTLRHYGVADQAIMTLNRARQLVHLNRFGNGPNRTSLTDMLDEHYNNPYSEIQYGNAGGFGQQVGNDSSLALRQPRAVEAKSWHLIKSGESSGHLVDSPVNESSSSSNSPSMLLLGNENLIQPQPTSLKMNAQQQFYHPSSSSTSSTANVLDTNSTSANSFSMNMPSTLAKQRAEQQPLYCQIGSTSAPSQHETANNDYYCQIGQNTTSRVYCQASQATNSMKRNGFDREREQQIYLTRMLTSKGTVQSYIDDFFKTILSARSTNSQAFELNNFNSVLCAEGGAMSRKAASNLAGACPPAVKWLFDLLDEAAADNGIADEDVIHAWKSNAFLLRFWVNLIKNPNYVLDVEKTNTLDATLSVVAQTLMDSCSVSEQQLTEKSSCNKMLFAKDIPKYRGQVKQFYRDIASMRPVSDQEIIKQMGSLSASNTERFDTRLALKELCVYAANYGVELMESLNSDYTCHQLDLSHQLEQCFRSLSTFEAYR